LFLLAHQAGTLPLHRHHCRVCGCGSVHDFNRQPSPGVHCARLSQLGPRRSDYSPSGAGTESSFLLSHTNHTSTSCLKIDRFLNSLEDLDAKFKLIWFSDLVPLFQQDAYLSFLHPFIIAYLSQSKWGRCVECFQNPMDEKWLDYLHRLTPSFLIMSLGNASENFVKEEINFATRFISIGSDSISVMCVTCSYCLSFSGPTAHFDNTGGPLQLLHGQFLYSHGVSALYNSHQHYGYG
jgi:hypothetical protein